jgi:hypothetical protein
MMLQGLLRMSLLERLCYLVEKCRPQPPAVNQMIEILVRVARHSMQSAYKVCFISCMTQISINLMHYTSQSISATNT